ncbi:MAG: hypothetical protein DI639_17835 [Leifsonia xyli]|nr:MAG: hypothetical protein DI639_17835 [Leifsonia xyli]
MSVEEHVECVLEASRIQRPVHLEFGGDDVNFLHSVARGDGLERQAPLQRSGRASYPGIDSFRP